MNKIIEFPGLNVIPGVQAELGEGPVWHSGEQVFYWIDISDFIKISGLIANSLFQSRA